MGVITVRYHRKSSDSVHGSFGKDMLQAIRENQAVFILALLFLAGMGAGAVYSRNAQFCAVSRLDFLFAGNFKARLTQPLLSVFSASFASAFLFIFACFLCGLSMWGAFLIPAVLIFRGFGLGLTSGYLYAAFAWKGILYNLAVILPGAFLCCVSLLLASLAGIRYSRMLASRRAVSEDVLPMRDYLLQFGAVLALAFGSALLDTLMSSLFGGCFSF